MQIGVIGTGSMGGGLGRLWAAQGHKVKLGSRDPERVGTMAGYELKNLTVGTIAESAKFGDVILLATPWIGARDALNAAGSLDGKVLIDCTNPFTEDYSTLLMGHTASGAEEIARMAPRARVVKALNSVAAPILANPRFGELQATAFYCGDDPQAKEIASSLINELGFETIDAGPLAMARFLEPLALLYVKLAIDQKMGFEMAWKLLRR